MSDTCCMVLAIEHIFESDYCLGALMTYASMTIRDLADMADAAGVPPSQIIERYEPQRAPSEREG